MKYFTKNVFAFLLAMTFVGMTSNLMAQTPFFSEDFDGGLPADWSTEEIQGNGATASNWMHTTVGPTGSFAIAPLFSTTAANGWMVFDSDLNCSGAQEVRLASPVIDASDRDAVFIRYENYYRRFNDLIYVETSIDGGATWQSIDLYNSADVSNTDYSSGDPLVNPHLVILDLSDVGAGQASFQFAFRFLADASTVIAGTDIGCGYSWQIDDVGLFDENPIPAVNYSLTPFYYYEVSSFSRPIDHLDAFPTFLGAEVANDGSADLTNVVLRATIENEDGDIVYADSVMVDVIPALTADTLEIEETFNSEGLDLGLYFINYTVYSVDTPDANDGDNFRFEAFVVSEDTWSKSFETEFTTIGQDVTDIITTNIYYSSPNLVPNSLEFNTVTFASEVDAADGVLTGRECTVILSKVNDDEVDVNWGGFDTNTDLFSNTGLTILGAMPYTYDSEELLHSVEVVDFDGNPIAIEPGARYFVSVQYQGDDNVIRHGYNDNIDYQFAFRNTILYVVNDQWYNIGFGSDMAATIITTQRLPVATEDTPLPAAAFNAFPNPTNEQISLEVDLENTGKANIILADITGRIMKVNEYDNLNNGTYSFDVSNYPNGVYMARLITGDGSRTIKFTVQH